MIRRILWIPLVIMALVMVSSGEASAQQKKLVYWTNLEQHPHFNKWFETKGKEFAKKTGYEVEAVVIPYQGYEAKYLSMLGLSMRAPQACAKGRNLSAIPTGCPL